MKKTSQYLALAMLALCGAASSAMAQNTLHEPGDLVLHFQNPGGLTGSTQTVLVSLGASANIRDAAAGSFTLLNTANIGTLGSTLTTTFGASWWDAETLWAGAAVSRGTSLTNTTLFTGDPGITLYATKVRNGIGTIGQANSTPITTNDSKHSLAGPQIVSMKNNLETIGSNTAIGVVPVSGTSQVDKQNPFIGANQQTAYSAFENGIQGKFGAGSLGSFGDAGNVELGLDLYRWQSRNNVNSQYGFGEANFQPEYLGTLTINQTGQVGFLAVPEPSTIGLLLLSVAGVALRRRRVA